MKKTTTKKKLALSKSSDGKAKRLPKRQSERFNDKPKGRKKDFSKSHGERALHEITCAKCGNVDTVPFKPTTKKPVLCKHCFGKVDRREAKGYDSKPRPRRDFNRPDSNAKQFDELNKKLDKILALLEAE